MYLISDISEAHHQEKSLTPYSSMQAFSVNLYCKHLVLCFLSKPLDLLKELFVGIKFRS